MNDLDKVDRAILAALQSDGRMSNARLAETVGLSETPCARRLKRLELRGLLSAEWGVSDNNRRAKFYALTATGKKQLMQETEYWRRMSGAIARVLQTA